MKKIFLLVIVMMLGLVGISATPHRDRVAGPPEVTAIATSDAAVVVPTLAIVPDIAAVPLLDAALGDPGVLLPIPQAVIDTGPLVTHVMVDRQAEPLNHRLLTGAGSSAVLTVDYALVC